jgi:hypothetical protein
MQSEQHQIATPLRIAFACPRDLNDLARHYLRYGIAAGEQLLGVANGFKSGRQNRATVRFQIPGIALKAWPAPRGSQEQVTRPFAAYWNGLPLTALKQTLDDCRMICISELQPGRWAPIKRTSDLRQQVPESGAVEMERLLS